MSEEGEKIIPTKHHRALSWGIHILKTTHQLGYDALVNYTIGHETLMYQVLPYDMKSDDLNSDDLASMVTICFNVAEYLQWWLGDKPSTLTRPDLVNVKDNKDLMSLSDGVYYLDFEGSEGHHFVWLIQGDQLYYGGGYGSVKEFSVVQFDKSTYFDILIKAMKGDLPSYRYVFNLQPPYDTILTVGFDCLKIQKSMLYV